MPKLLCRCENEFNLSLIPCPDKYLFMSVQQFDQLPQDGIDGLDLRLQMRSMLKCPQCGRLYVFWDDNSPVPTVYVLDNNQPKPRNTDRRPE